MHEEHTITTEQLDEANGPVGWKVTCSCGWTCYCETADEVQQAIYEHRADLVRRGLP